jgi:hypothetical protein
VQVQEGWGEGRPSRSNERVSNFIMMVFNSQSREILQTPTPLRRRCSSCGTRARQDARDKGYACLTEARRPVSGTSLRAVYLSHLLLQGRWNTGSGAITTRLFVWCRCRCIARASRVSRSSARTSVSQDRERRGQEGAAPRLHETAQHMLEGAPVGVRVGSSRDQRDLIRKLPCRPRHEQQ